MRKSNKYLAAIASAITILTFTLPAIIGAADVPQTLSYQGNLTDSTGQPVTGSHQIIFNLYNALSGGTSFWTETQTVQVTAGKFAVVLGKTTPLDTTQFTGDTYIGIRVDGGAEMVPRQQFTSVAYALKAGSLVNIPNSIPQGGIIMWSGATNAIPDGWALCNGQNGTPNLTDRFIIGAGNTYGVGSNAGNTTHSHTINDHSHLAPDHLHNIAHDHFVSRVNNGSYWSEWGSGLDTGGDYAGFTYGSQTNNSSGACDRSMQTGGATDRGMTSQSNMPPYYALAFIMKL